MKLMPFLNNKHGFNIEFIYQPTNTYLKVPTLNVEKKGNLNW